MSTQARTGDNNRPGAPGPISHDPVGRDPVGPQPAAMKIVFLSHTAMGGSFVVGSHHLAATLASAGHDVTHVSAAVSPAHLALLRDPFVRTRWRRWLTGGERIRGVDDKVPLTLLPWNIARRSPFLMKAYSRSILADPLHGRGSLRLDQADALIVDEPRFVGLVPSASRQVVVYRPTDLYALMRHDSSIDAAESLLCTRANVLVATSEGVAAHLRTLCSRQAHVMNNGVDFEHFSRAVADDTFELPARREDRAVYVGSFDGRFSVEALTAAAKELPGKQFILAGPGSDSLSSIAGNVTALGAIEYSALPRLLRQCAVGLLPFSADALNAARSPMKLYEYAAAGLAIAATASSAHQAVIMPSLCVAFGDRQFPEAVSQAFRVAQDAPKLDAARACAQRESWSAKASRLLELIREAQSSAVDARGPASLQVSSTAVCTARSA